MARFENNIGDALLYEAAHPHSLPADLDVAVPPTHAWQLTRDEIAERVVRTADVVYLPGATKFTADDDLSDPVEIIRLLKQLPQLLKLLEQGFGLRFDPKDPGQLAEWFGEDGYPVTDTPGRKRMPGSFVLLFIVFVMGRIPSAQAFRHMHRSNETLWIECGFTRRNKRGNLLIPSYKTLARRFNELEDYLDRQVEENVVLEDGFKRAADACIAHARKHAPVIGRAAIMDGTAASTHAALVHACPVTTECGLKQLDQAEAAGDARKPGPKGVAYGTRIPRPSVKDINQERADEGKEALEDESAARSPRALKRLNKEEIEKLHLDPDFLWWAQRELDATDKNGKPVPGRDHYFCCKDTTVGARNYRQTAKSRGTFWLGWNIIKLVDVYTGAAISVTAIEADKQEYHEYPALAEKARASIGVYPQMVSGDRGLSIKSVYEFNTRRGIATVTPFRQTPQHKRRRELENEIVDRHGVPRCPACGAEGKTRGRGLGFRIEDGTPRIYFACSARITPGCSGTKHVDCEQEWRLLQPLNITDETYHQMRQVHGHHENIHRLQRQRYSVGGREISVRDHRMGVRRQQLRLHAAMLLEWLRICLRQGWLASVRKATNHALPTGRGPGTRLAKTLKARAEQHLHLPYGPKAYPLGGWHDPPWVTHPPKKRK